MVIEPVKKMRPLRHGCTACITYSTQWFIFFSRNIQAPQKTGISIDMATAKACGDMMLARNDNGGMDKTILHTALLEHFPKYCGKMRPLVL